MSGSAVAAQRRLALADSPATAMLFVDPELRICLTAGATSAGGDVDSFIGLALVDVIDAPAERSSIEGAARSALGGEESELDVQTRHLGWRRLRFVPVAGRLNGAGAVLVAVSRSEPTETELDELRTRASDLETLSAAASRLARALDRQEVGRIVCEAAAEVAMSDFAVLLEPRDDGSTFDVTAAWGVALEGKLAVGESALAAEAFQTGRPVLSDELLGLGSPPSWPLQDAGAHAAVWQPVPRESGVLAVLAVGWRRRIRPSGQRLRTSLALLADEAAVTLERASAVERLTVLARTDPLTDLYNRRAWQDELGRELARATRAGDPPRSG